MDGHVTVLYQGMNWHHSWLANTSGAGICEHIDMPASACMGTSLPIGNSSTVAGQQVIQN